MSKSQIASPGAPPKADAPARPKAEHGKTHLRGQIGGYVIVSDTGKPDRRVGTYKAKVGGRTATKSRLYKELIGKLKGLHYVSESIVETKDLISRSEARELARISHQSGSHRG